MRTWCNINHLTVFFPYNSIFTSLVAISHVSINGFHNVINQCEECAAQIQLCAWGLWERQDKSQRQFQPLRQVHGHQLQLQRGPHWRTHQQLLAGEGEGILGRMMEKLWVQTGDLHGSMEHNNELVIHSFGTWCAHLWKKSSAHLVFRLRLLSWTWMFHEVMTKRCQGTSMNRCICEANVLLLPRVNEWLTWGYLMLLYLSALLKIRLALRAGVNDGAMIHFQKVGITTLFLCCLASASAVKWCCCDVTTGQCLS